MGITGYFSDGRGKMIRKSISNNIFEVFNYFLVGFIAILCLLPLLNVLAISFSSSTAAGAGLVTLWPVEFTVSSYKYALTKVEFVASFLVSSKRLILGCAVNMFFTALTAYPLSREDREFKGRTLYTWYFFLTMLISGGLIPTYFNVRNLGLLDNIWALVLPGAVPVFNVVLLLNFYRSLPKELSEAAFVDGAGHWITLWKIYIPLSKPALATIFLFTCVNHWNSWFDGLIYMNSPIKYPLQTYLQTLLVETVTQPSMLDQNQLNMLSKISDSTLKASQIFLAALPILCIYPFLQRYFVKGLVIGSVKG